MTDRALSFGQVASDYERFRLGYPDELVDEILAYAGRPIRTALEIGAGTGKATRVLARSGIAITATDPDEAMLAELRRHVPATVTTLRSALEDLPVTSVYDLVFAAASLHWTEPGRRWSRIAALLEPQGVFASFGGPMWLGDPADEEAVRRATSPEVPEDRVTPPDGSPLDDPSRWPAGELAGSKLFTDVRHTVLERRTTMPARDYVGQLSTVSAYVVLPGPVRREVLGRALAALPEQVAVAADIGLTLARRS